MGNETFKQLWKKRDSYDLVLLVRPSKRNKKMFSAYEKAAGIKPIPGSGTVEGDGLKIVWGDILNKADVIEACRGIDCCLHVLALISPEADRNPEMAHRVNYLGTLSIVEAIEAEDPENIRMVYVGTVAEYGDRLPPFQVGRAGDPVVPSKLDYYAISKVAAELAVMQSRIKHRVSMRQTFIMITDLFSLMDPIMFHQPINSFMENITARDAGRLMLACLDQPADSSFWGGYYNISGGPACRTTFYHFLDAVFKTLGLRTEHMMERNWFALKNFHMLFYEDSQLLNSYLHHWEGGISQEGFYADVARNFTWYLKLVAWLSKNIPPVRWLVEQITRLILKKLSLETEGTMRWIKDRNQERISAFFGSMERWEAIPGWNRDMPSLDPELPHQRLDHGYDESKEKLELKDLQEAAVFRGGALKDADWDGDMQVKLSWDCCLGHSFEMTPHAALKGGHWCPECLTPPWKTDEIAKKNKFVGQLFHQKV